VVGNVDAAILTFNGNWVGEQKLVKNSASWEVTLLPGLNKIEVRSTDEKVTDEQTILAETQREDKLAINVGTEFFFDDRKGTLWMPERENESNSWRLVGGEIFRPRDRGFGTDHSINGTDEEPLYQTMRMGVERVEAEVQPGAYKVTLHFSEPQWNAGERIFDIIINGQAIWADVDIAATAGRHFPMALSTEIDVNKNIIVELIPRKGETLLCGIQIEKKW
jgi:beta-galactosidase